MRFQIAVTSEHVADFEFCLASSEIRRQKEERKKESVVKHKSDNRYVGWPNKKSCMAYQMAATAYARGNHWQHLRIELQIHALNLSRF